MSEHPHDDEELEAFLSRESELTRRYRESGDEQPPAHVDAAILAASRWAVGADRTGADRAGADRNGAGPDRSGARLTGSHHAASPHVGVRWRRSNMARWSVPLAMAAVLVLAVTLTIMIERDPELDRIYERHDARSAAEGEAIRNSAFDEAKLAAPSAPAGKTASPGLTAQSSEPAPALPLAKQESADVSPPAKEQLAQIPAQEQLAQKPADLDNLAARKRSALTQDDAAVERSETRDAPLTLAEEQVAQSAAPAQTPAEPFPDSVSTEIRAADRSDSDPMPLEETAGLEEIASLDEAADESVDAGASALPEAEESLPSSVATPGRQQALAPAPATLAEADRELAEPADMADAAAEPMRDPAQWIKDIEDLLAQGSRVEAIDSLKEFRLEYPDYELPPELLALLPTTSD